MNHFGDITKSAARTQVLATYTSRLSGSDAGLFVAVGGAAIAESARTAIAKSAEALGYGPAGATFLCLKEEDGSLDPDQLFQAIEGLDPLCVVAVDAEAAHACAQAYRAEISPQVRCRVFGRETRAFDNLESMLESPEGKQRVWSLLKTLPRYPS